jgi:hypothetical protein
MEVLLCSGFPHQLLLIGVLTAAGLNLRTDDSLGSPAFVFTLSLLDTVLVVGLVFLFLIIHGESPRAVLLGDRPVLHGSSQASPCSRSCSSWRSSSSGRS